MIVEITEPNWTQFSALETVLALLYGPFPTSQPFEVLWYAALADI